MKLNKTIRVRPNPTTDSNTGNIIQGDEIVTDELKIVITDYVDRKYLMISFENIPGVNFAINHGDKYDESGMYTRKDIEEQIRSSLGSDPEDFIQSLFPATVEQDPTGPGYLLTEMIKSIGITSSSSCSCRRHAIEMNEKGNDWCEKNIDTVISWLKDESQKRNLPFVEAVGKMIVKRAIAKSRKLNHA